MNQAWLRTPDCNDILWTTCENSETSCNPQDNGKVCVQIHSHTHCMIHPQPLTLKSTLTHSLLRARAHKHSLIHTTHQSHAYAYEYHFLYNTDSRHTHTDYLHCCSCGIVPSDLSMTGGRCNCHESNTDDRTRTSI